MTNPSAALLYITVLQRVAACCSVLQRGAACCSMLQRVAVWCSVMLYVAVSRYTELS